MTRSKRVEYKQINETGEKVEKEEVESNQTEEVSNLFRTISISKDLQSLNAEESMDKQKSDALVMDETTIGEGTDDYIDENNVENVLSIEEVDEKIQRIAELRTAYRKKQWIEGATWFKLWRVICWRWQVSQDWRHEKLDNESQYGEER